MGRLLRFFRGLWRWFAVFAALGLLVRIFFTYLNRSDSMSPLVWGACAILVEAAGVMLALVFGKRVNQLRWRLGRLRSLQDLSGERAWIFLGVVWEIISAIVGAMAAMDRSSQYGIVLAFAVNTRLILLGGIWFARAGAGGSD
ncbi:MAG: hypothetical protein Q8K89_00805 [Actinomycetota bacterium]|nr:hypothetical protein [Actinomycetota bacterium]